MFLSFKDRTFTFRILILFVSFLARKYIQNFNPTTPTGNLIISIILKISKVFIIYQSINIMADLALALVNLITKFMDEGDDANMSKIFDFFTKMMIGGNVALFVFACFQLRNFPDSLENFLLAMFAAGFIYVVRNFEGFQQYTLMGILGIAFALLIYSKL